MGLDITGIGSVADILGKVFDKVSHYIPDPTQKAEAQQKLAEMAQAEEFKQIDAAFEAAKQQTDINKIEAASSNWFVSSWRPFCGWVGGAGLAYAAILDPLLRFSAKVWFGYSGEFPEVDTTITMQVLFGLLGLGAMRSFDKVKGVPHDK